MQQISTRHPDKNPSTKREQATATFAKIASAWEKLGTPDARAIYDDFGDNPKVLLTAVNIEIVND